MKPGNLTNKCRLIYFTTMGVGRQERRICFKQHFLKRNRSIHLLLRGVFCERADTVHANIQSSCKTLFEVRLRICETMQFATDTMKIIEKRPEVLESIADMENNRQIVIERCLYLRLQSFDLHFTRTVVVEVIQPDFSNCDHVFFRELSNLTV